MFAACTRGKFDIVNYLIAHSADVNFPDDIGHTALFWGEYIFLIILIHI